MKAGRLRDRVTIKHNARSADKLGEVVPSWTTIAADLPAEVNQSPGQQNFEQNSFTASTPISVAIRYRGDVFAQQTLEWEGGSYRITSCVDPDGRRKQLHLICTKDA